MGPEKIDGLKNWFFGPSIKSKVIKNIEY